MRNVTPRNEGFTLVEGVAVLTLVAILTLVLASFAFDTTARVTGETAILSSHVRFVQALAMSINTATWSLSIGDGSYAMLRNGVTSPVNLPGENSATHTLPEGLRVVAGAGVLSFDEWGSPGGATRVITISNGEEARSVTVTRNTGFVP